MSEDKRDRDAKLAEYVIRDAISCPRRTFPRIWMLIAMMIASVISRHQLPEENLPENLSSVIATLIAMLIAMMIASAIRYVHLPEDLKRARELQVAAEAAAREAIEQRADAEADVLRQLDESAQLLERLLVEQVPLMSTDDH